MLNERDIIVLKLALERSVLDASAYVKVLDLLQRGERLGLALRQAGAPGDKVSDLVSAAEVQATTGAVLTRCDAENTLMRRFLQSSGVRPEQIEEGDCELTHLAQAGQFCSLDEVFVNRGWLPLLTAVALRTRVKERLATCGGCWRHFLLQPDNRKVRCPACKRVVRGGEGLSATDACRTLLTESQQAAQGAANASASGTLPAARPPSHPSGRYPVPGSAVHRAPAAGAGPSTSRRSVAAAPALGAPSAPTPPRTAAVAPAPPQVDEFEPVGRFANTTARFGAPSKTGSVDAPATIPLDDPASAPRVPPRRESERLAALPDVELPGLPDVPAPRGLSDTASGSSHDDVSEASDFDESSIGDDLLTSQDAVAKFGSYEIVTEVARGAMGIVYKARRAGSERPLALKVLMAGERATPKQVARFEREAHAARRFAHPGIVRIEETGAHQGYHYIVMEFVEGETLERALKERGPLDPCDAAQVIAQVADAVSCIHAGDVVHRDLKPGNIIIKDGQHPKLIDFGLAKVVQEEKLTRTGVMVGTPFYMAPEQVKGKGDVGPTSDIYALGSILYELVCGRPPFVGQNYGELFAAIVNTEPPAPRALREDLPPALEAIVLRCIAKDPKARYASARALKEDLERFLAGARTEAGRRHAAARAVRAVRLVATLALAAGLLAGAAWVGSRALRGDGDLAGKVQALHDEARGHMAKDDHHAASRLLTAAQALDPGRADVAALLGRCLVADGEVDAGFAELERAVTLGWTDPALLDAPELAPVKDDPRLAALRQRLGR